MAGQPSPDLSIIQERE